MGQDSVKSIPRSRHPRVHAAWPVFEHMGRFVISKRATVGHREAAADARKYIGHSLSDRLWAGNPLTWEVLRRVSDACRGLEVLAENEVQPVCFRLAQAA